MAKHNLVNMVAVTAVSAAVLLILVAAKHFWRASDAALLNFTVVRFLRPDGLSLPGSTGIDGKRSERMAGRRPVHVPNTTFALNHFTVPIATSALRWS
jgi:hypothetical protein